MLPVDDDGAEGRIMEGVGREPKGRTPYGSSRLPKGVWRFDLEDDDEEEGVLCFPDEWEEGAPLNGGGGRLPFGAEALLSLGFGRLMTDDVAWFLFGSGRGGGSDEPAGIM